MSLIGYAFMTGEQFMSDSGSSQECLYEIIPESIFFDKKRYHPDEKYEQGVECVLNHTAQIIQYATKDGITLQKGRIHKCFRHV